MTNNTYVTRDSRDERMGSKNEFDEKVGNTYVGSK